MADLTSGEARAFSVSVVTNTDPNGKLCKVHQLDPVTGEVVTTANAVVTRGRVKRLPFASIRAFMGFRAKLQRCDALMMGTASYPEARLVTQTALARIPSDQARTEQIIARDREHVSWPDGPALVMLDLDHPDRCPPELQSTFPTTPEAWRSLLITCVPALESVPMAWAASSSSCLSAYDVELRGVCGQRFYVVISNGADTPRFAQGLRDALALRGLVWCEVSKSGRLLERFPFDMAVFQPERLDFAAGPDCIAPLEWQPPQWQTWNDVGPYLAASNLHTVTEGERRRIADTLRSARRAKADAAAMRRAEWVKETGRGIADRSQMDPTLAEGIARAAVERMVLLPAFELTDEDGETVSVGDLLKNPGQHHLRRFHDPLDPDYRNDPRVAVFLARAGGAPRIFSHAHGGQSWLCMRAIPEVLIGQIHETVDQIRIALERDDCGLYRSGDGLAWINEQDARMLPLAREALGLRLQRHFNVLKRRQNKWVPADLSTRGLDAVLSEASTLPLPQLNAVVHGPFALADGSVVDTPGYDPASQVFYAACSPHSPRARRQLGLPETNEVLRQLWFPAQYFPLTTAEGRGALLAALLSAVVRPSIAIAPGYYITAPAAGTGKTLLASVIGALQTGELVASSPWPGSEEERRKTLFASALQGASFVLFDNAGRGTMLDSAVLSQQITSPSLEGRVLGLSRTERRPNRLTIVLTGNNLTVSGDLNRRLFPITMDARAEHPWQREFPFHPVSYVLANWLALRIAALELIQAWRSDGAPRAPGAIGFPEWDAVVRSVVAWVGKKLAIGVEFADPAEALRAAYADDPETDSLGNLLEALVGVFENREFQLKDVEDVVKAAEEMGANQHHEPTSRAALTLAEARRAVLGDIDRWKEHGSERARFGMCLNRYEGRIVRGLKLVKSTGTSGGARRWRVARVQEVSQTTPASPPVVGGK